ncbi:NADPH:quinone reductase [Halorussus amylolyticus]|uniref:NADPH:quinone reductase n=1 Tax=Halorussus amylolyticus TaxID=1126242 RepID=UPI0010499F37|nr:NADPH:quinone reductase [Halorussus amylolyticus]
MRAVRYHEHGGPETLQIDDIDEPAPDAGEIRIEVRAAGVNPVDTYFREGSYPPPELPMIPGSDVAGIVDAVGEGVEKFAQGDRVFATGLGNDRQGTYAEYAVAPTDRVAHLPENATFEEGAAVALVGVTAWRALVDHAALEPAETCLVHGGSGGVGHIAVQIAEAAGARVITTADPEYHDDLAELGADAPLDYGRDDLADAVVAAGRPDAILDHRLDDYLDFDAEVGTQGVRVVGIGNTQPEAGFDNIAAARGTEMRLQLMSMFNTPEMAAVLEKLARLLDDGDLRPEIARRYDLAEAADAQRAVLDDSFLGKLILEL